MVYLILKNYNLFLDMHLNSFMDICIKQKIHQNAIQINLFFKTSGQVIFNLSGVRAIFQTAA